MASKIQILFIGHWIVNPEDWGAVQTHDLNQAFQLLKTHEFESIAATTTVLMESKFIGFLEQVKSMNPWLPLLGEIPSELPAKKIFDLHNKFHFDIIVPNTHIQESALFQLIEKVHEKRQRNEFLKMIQDQSLKLESAQQELELRIEKRTKLLSESRAKLFHTNSRIELLKNVLLAINEATTLFEIEKLLNETLSKSIQLLWIKILFHPNDELFSQQLENQLEFNKLKIPLYNLQEKIGSVIYLKSAHSKFTKEDSQFLHKVSDAIVLSLLRVSKLSEIELVREQWQLTFKSMTDQIYLIDENFDIVQSNSTAATLGKKCYEFIFKRNTPCQGCHRGERFKVLDPESRLFEVYSQKVPTNTKNSQTVYVHFYRDISQMQKMERQIIESSKLAELGTIGSSIAHELNNPLGGILSFAQLIKMDLNPSDPIYPDIIEIESGVFRCRDIIENLLGFTRNTSSDIETLVDLREVCNRSLKIIELKSKALGIHIEMKPSLNEMLITGHLNLLAQALKNIFQNSMDSISQNSINGKISVSLHETDSHFQIFVEDNGKGMTSDVLQKALTPLFTTKSSSSHIGLGLPIAQQIIVDHRGTIDFSSKPDFGTLAKISFPRPVFNESSRP